MCVSWMLEACSATLALASVVCMLKSATFDQAVIDAKIAQTNGYTSREANATLPKILGRQKLWIRSGVILVVLSTVFHLLTVPW